MTFGLSDDGFTIKRESDIIADLEAGFKAEFGEINTEAAAVFGQTIGVISKPLAELWELMELIYLSQYPSSAEGISLDGVVHLTGVTRLGSGNTVVTGILIGDQGTNVLTGFSASIDDTGEVFFTTEDVTIDKANVLRCGIEVTSVVAFYTYIVTIDGDDYDYLASSGPDKDEIINGLVAAINVGQSKVTASPDGDETMTIEVDNKITPFSVVAGTNLGIDEIATPVEFEAQNSGSVLAVAGSLTKIETPISGVDAVDNLTDGAIGRDVETDTELRIRRELSLRILGAATAEAIRARLLQEVSGVSAVKVLENDTDTFNNTIEVTVDTAADLTDYSVFINNTEFKITSDATATIEEIALALVNAINLGSEPVVATDNTDGTFDVDPDDPGLVYTFTVGERLSQYGAMPPHSFQAVVSGGDDQAVADKIWEVKAGGIAAWGNTALIVEDSEGDEHGIRFTRPTDKYAWIRVELTMNPEEDFPSDGIDQVKNNILALGNAFNVSDDYIIQKFYGPIYDVEGISDVDIEIATTDSPVGTPSYVTTNISISSTEILKFDLDRILVSIP